MEVQNPQPGHIIEVSGDVSVGGSSLVGSKICEGAACGLSHGGTGSNDAKERSASMKKLWVAVTLCVIFMTVEVVGGIKANSLAILTDAAHLLSDVAAFAISLFSLWASGWEATPRQSYGFFRIEILGALVSIQMIWLLAGILVYEAIARLISNTGGEVKGRLMFIVSAFGLVVNVIMAVLLGHDHGHGGHGGHGHDHGHGGFGENDHSHGDHSHDDQGHGHSHSHGISITRHEHHEGHRKHIDEHKHAHEDPVEPLLKESSDDSQSTITHKEKKHRNINVQGAYLHVLGDSIQSIGVMVGGAIIWYKPKLKIVDLICTLIFSVIVLGTTIRMLRSILEVLMESTPREIDATMLEKGLCEIDEVVAIHELHIWAITVGKILLACHVTIEHDADADMVLDKVIGYIKREYNISHITIQIERE